MEFLRSRSCLSTLKLMDLDQFLHLHILPHHYVRPQIFKYICLSIMTKETPLSAVRVEDGKIAKERSTSIEFFLKTSIQIG